jgi:hypothetical protein
MFIFLIEKAWAKIHDSYKKSDMRFAS